jgi:DNA-directed RNA polymerase I subunit RPA2
MSKPSKKTLNEQIRFTQKVVSTGLRNVSKHHVESFDYAFQKVLPRICKYMLPVEVTQPTLLKEGESPFPFKKYLMWFENFELRKPVRQAAAGLMLKQAADGSNNAMIYPAECRLRGLTYQAPLYATFCRKIDDEPEEKINILLGDIPIMVRS